MASEKSTNMAGMSISDNPPSYNHAQSSATKTARPQLSGQSNGPQLIFVEARYVGGKANPAKIYRHPGTEILYTHRSRTTTRYKPFDIPIYEQSPVEVISVDFERNLQDITDCILAKIVQDGDDLYYSGYATRVKVDGLSVAWQGQESMQRFYYNDQGFATTDCHTLLTGKNDEEVRTVFLKMAERGWRDRLVLFFHVGDTIKATWKS
ncbi:uncharacterized protein RAG0_17130 [Rhynchosporium agropyri]|uniref:Uncharacterized protein n=2 Tax=Rhynchosporium TaxID=38037 RepID=A0A1E1MWL1_RHYSE|nr:uncharacterized protein RAG0_17130 [Rhynchosporium agropyri]CZT53458.1 uncharacterized protein RSE6_15042 [Rhynchosporium secalis]